MSPPDSALFMGEVTEAIHSYAEPGEPLKVALELGKGQLCQSQGSHTHCALLLKSTSFSASVNSRDCARGAGSRGAST